MRLTFSQVDVFSPVSLGGNPVAVVHGADDLTTEQMARFASWTNLSETTFLLHPTHPDADYALRIFTPNGEIPFAGHPTLGSCHAWLSSRDIPRSGSYVQECAIGLVEVRQDGDRLAFAAPPLRRSGDLETHERDEIVRLLGLSDDDVVHAQHVDNGPPWVGLLLASAERVLELTPNLVELRHFVGVIGPHAPGGEADFEVRAFAPTAGVPEDPVTGSLNAGLAQWLIGAGIAPATYVAAQGTALGRVGRVHVDRHDGAIWIGGAATTVIGGTVRFEKPV